MKLLKECPYQYGEFSSEDTDNGRFYDCNGQKLPSVTTVLSGTKDEDKQKTLDILDKILNGETPKPGSYRGRVNNEPENNRKTLMDLKNA